MGQRDVKRVPLDFDHPQGEVWPGYLLPESLQERPCGDCDKTGTTSARQWVEQLAALCLMLNTDLAAQKQGRPLHPYLVDTGSRAQRRPSTDIAEFAIGLAGRGEPGRFHDAIDNWRATDRLIEAAGLDPKVWGICPTCSGHGYTEKYDGQRAEAETWEPTDPPVGEGWQLWETTSEGSPVSPVFGSAEALAEWAEGNATLFAGQRATYAEWLSMFRADEVDIGSTMMFRVPAGDV
jgi:hypothetical protein